MVCKLFLLIWHNINNNILCFPVYFGRSRATKFCHVPCKLDDKQLHAIAKTKVWDFLFSGVANHIHLPFDTTRPKSSRNNYSVVIFEFIYFLVVLFKIARIKPMQYWFPVFIIRG